MSNSGINKEAQQELVITLYHVVLVISLYNNVAENWSLWY